MELVDIEEYNELSYTNLHASLEKFSYSDDKDKYLYLDEKKIEKIEVREIESKNKIDENILLKIIEHILNLKKISL